MSAYRDIGATLLLVDGLLIGAFSPFVWLGWVLVVLAGMFFRLPSQVPVRIKLPNGQRLTIEEVFLLQEEFT